MSIATFHVDVDDFADLTPEATRARCRARGVPSIYATGVRRFARLLDARGLPATFFVVGRDVAEPENADVLHELVAAGHEVANHTFSHPLAPTFCEQPYRRQVDEVVRGEQALRSLLGRSPLGFKAPAYSLRETRLLDLLHERGYLYDASVCPVAFSPALSAAQYALTGRRRARGHWGGLLNGLAPQEPYHPSTEQLWRRGGHPLVEVPISTVPLLRLPFHASIAYATSPWWFRFGLAAARAAGRALVFQFHAVELVAADEMPAEARPLRPGATLPLSRKIALVTEMIEAVAAGRLVLTTADVARRVPGPNPGQGAPR